MVDMYSRYSLVGVELKDTGEEGREGERGGERGGEEGGGGDAASEQRRASQLRGAFVSRDSSVISAGFCLCWLDDYLDNHPPRQKHL